MSKEEAKIVANDDSGISCEDGCDFSMGEYCRVCGEGLTWEQLHLDGLTA